MQILSVLMVIAVMTFNFRKQIRNFINDMTPSKGTSSDDLAGVFSPVQDGPEPNKHVVWPLVQNHKADPKPARHSVLQRQSQDNPAQRKKSIGDRLARLMSKKAKTSDPFARLNQT